MGTRMAQRGPMREVGVDRVHSNALGIGIEPKAGAGY